MSLTTRSVIRFEEYEIDRAQWRTTWREEAVPLNRKTFDLLLYLLDRRERVVSKDEILKALWPDQFVEESNLTQHVFLLRKALSRHESGVKLIETIPGRGYRFTASVETPAITEQQMTVSVTQSFTHIAIEEEREDAESYPGEDSSKHKLQSRFTLFSVCGAMLLLCCIFMLRWRSMKAANARAEVPASSTLLARPSIAVLEFHNSSARPEDAWLSTAIADMLAAEMTAGDDLRVIPTENIARAEADLGLVNSPVDSESKRVSLSNATGADTLLKGSYVVLGHGAAPMIRLMIQLEDARSGKQMASLSRTGDLLHLFDLIDDAGAQVRNELSHGSSRAEQEQALSGMSHNVDALRFYAEALDQQRSFDAHSARSLFERAVAADPNFAMAHLGLADAWSELGFMDRARSEAGQAMKLSDNLPRAERLAVEADYRELSNEPEQAIGLYQQLRTYYPDDVNWGLKLAKEQTDEGRQRDAIATFESLRKLRLTPAEMVDLDGIEAGSYAHLDEAPANDQARTRLDEAVAIADKQGGLSIHARAYRYKCFALSHIGPVPVAQAACEQSRTLFQAVGNLEAVGAATNNLGVLAEQVSNWKMAAADYEEAGRIYHQLGSFESEVDELQNLALLDIARGELKDALHQALELSRAKGTRDDFHTSYEGHHYAAVALLLAGRLQEAKAEALAAQRSADREHPWDYKVYQQARSTDIRGWIALRAGDSVEANALFHEALARVEPTHDEAGEAIFTTDLATVTLEQGHPDDGVLGSVRHAAEVLSKLEDSSDEAVSAEIVLARLELKAGAIHEASQAIAEASKLDSAGDTLETHLDLLLAQAELHEAAGHNPEALRLLQEEVAAANAKGFLYSGLEGEIDLAQLNARIAPSHQDRSLLLSLGQKASAAGFKSLARRALVG